MKTHVTINGKEIDRITEVNKDWIAETLNELLTSLDGLTFEKKEAQKPFSVDNPLLGTELFAYDQTNNLFIADGEVVDTLEFLRKYKTYIEDAALTRVLQALKS